MGIKNSIETDGIVSDINMTPLIDVMLVLLIIFMVSSSAALESGLSVEVPESKAPASTPNSSLVVTLAKNGSLAVSGIVVTKNALKTALKNEIKKLQTTSIVLEGDGDSSLTSAIEIMDIAREAGAKDFSIAAKQK